MKRFPKTVRDAMSKSGAAATCLPVQLDGREWETALFVQVSGAECKDDRRAMRRCAGALAVSVETDLVEHEHAAVIVLRLEIFTREDDPLAAEILLTPGDSDTHFESLKLLSSQARLCWFFGDQSYWAVFSQAHPLAAAAHQEFDALLRDALRHDTLVRMTGRYDAQAALSHIVSHYELAAGRRSIGSVSGSA